MKKSDKDVIPVEVFAGSALQANMVKSILEDAEIEAFLKDEFSGTLYPWHSAGGGAGAVKVFVSSLVYDQARSLVDEYESNLNSG